MCRRVSNMSRHSRRFFVLLLAGFLGKCVLAVPDSAPTPASTEKSRAEARPLEEQAAGAAHLPPAPEEARPRLRIAVVTAQAAGSRERAAPGATEMPTIAEKTAGIAKLPGYFNLYWDAKQGKLWLEVDKCGTEFL